MMNLFQTKNAVVFMLACVSWITVFGTNGTVLIPHIAHSNGWETFLMINNSDNAPGEIAVVLYDHGVEVGRIVETVPAMDQKQIHLTQGTCGKVEFNGDELHLKESFIHSTDGGIAAFSLTNVSSQQLHFLLPQYHAQRLTWSGIAFYNPASMDTTVALRAYGHEGEVLAESSHLLPALTRKTGYISEFFPGLDFREVSRVRMVSETACSGLVISGNENRQLLFTQAVDTFSTGNLILSHIATDWENWSNMLILDNTGESTVSVDLSLYSNGNLVEEHGITIQAGSTEHVNLNQYAHLNPDFGSMQNGDATLAVRQGYSHMVQGGTAEFLLSSMVTEELLFDLATHAGSLDWNGISFCNASAIENRVTLFAYGEGSLLDSTEQVIHAQSRRAVLLSDLFAVSQDRIDKVMIEGGPGLSGLLISGFEHERFLFSAASKLWSGKGGMEYNNLYFPGTDEYKWERISPAEAGWSDGDVEEVLHLAESNNSSAMVILYRGRVMAEQYWEIESPSYIYTRLRLNTTLDGQPVEDVASVQKSICAVVAMLARDRGLLDVEKPVSEYIGQGWSKASLQQENDILVKHLLTMTSGLNDDFQYVVPAGTKWNYNTPVYARTHNVLEAATGRAIADMTEGWLTSILGTREMQWLKSSTNEVNPNRLSTTALDLARIGLMLQAKGTWRGTSLFNQPKHLLDALVVAQEVNSWYGYLWYINHEGAIVTTAPHDMRAAQGKLKRKLYVVPSLELVVVRIGDDIKDAQFFNNLWRVLN